MVAEPASDAATRFYERNYQWHAAQGDGEDEEARLRALMAGKNGRYSRAYAHIAAHPGLDVLELGCGSAELARIFGPLTNSYTLIDIVEARLGGQLPENVKTICANLDSDFSVADASVDVVNAMMVVEHLYDPFHSFAEIARVLRPGGTVFMNLPNIGSIRCRIDLLRGRLPQTSNADWFERREWDGNHLHYFTVASVRKIAALNGLEVTALAPVGNFARLKALRPQLLCHEITFVMHRI